MIQNKTFGSRLFTVINTVLLILMGLLCLLPVLHVFALSLSSSNAVSAGSVLFWPVQFT
ncbi:MAG: carbohydrate ABC transporter permease, partial [Lachnospiraceae bacterium]|nr:carbohydrate ABC transporter permease [Lachnospiraceae bacterium]